MKFTRNPLTLAVSTGLTAGAIGLLSMISLPALAQTQTQTQNPDRSVTELDRIQVTGSRIQRTEIEGPLPVTVISREDIELSGDLTVADVLRSSNFNSFGSFDAASGFAGGAQGGSIVSLRGLGSQRSLVLVDGRRIAASPAFAGAAQNLNAIPIAAVERIEVLRDGASAIYGADAIGGVINVIMRKDFEGLQVSGTFTAPSNPGGTERSGAIVGGVSSDRGNMVFTLDHASRDIIFYRDRDYLFNNAAPSLLGFPGSFQPVNPVTRQPTGPFQPDPRCPAAFDTDPQFPNSRREVVPGLGEFCTFRFASVAGQTAAVDRESLTNYYNYDITDNTSIFGRHTFTRGESFGRFAPAPAFFPRIISSTNPNNPVPGSDLTLAFRFVPLGTRDSTVNDTVLENLFGVRGGRDWFGGTDWELAVFHNRYEQNDIGTGYGLISNFRQAIADGSFNPFGNTPAAANFIRHTITTSNEFRDVGMDGQLNFSLFELPGGPVGFATGFEYRDTRFSTISDAQSTAGNVFGSAGGSALGERASYSLFAEALFPILTNLEVSLAGRYDSYNDFGTSFSPKVSVLFRPFETLLFRASYGEGFRAPTLEDIGRQSAQSFPAFIDQFGCFQNPTSSFLCTARQREISIGGNPNLEAETSEQYSAGIGWNITENFYVGVDAYRIELSNGIGATPLAQILANELRCRTGAQPCNPALLSAIDRDSTGNLLLVRTNPINFSGIETQGYDAEASYNWRTDTMGNLRLRAAATFVDEFTQTTVTSADLAGTAFAPKRRSNFSAVWTMGDFTTAVGANHIGSSCFNGGGSTGPCLNRIGTYTTVDASVGVKLPWNGEVTLGVRNLADREPVVTSGGTTSGTLHDFFGRVPYLRYVQNF
ncbi:MAG: TonB-dependent receptor [Pseudomonadota bacterium]|nr:TonB-dependent receptor [Pseudomonadota bacterium]